jgi:dTDP-4-dehydrorhamnose 3,5-epimerase-like enzyme
MKFQRLPIEGSYLITHKLHNDKRGSFGRQFCLQTFKKIIFFYLNVKDSKI